jgi:halimadienyl-diphosphate synthase
VGTGAAGRAVDWILSSQRPDGLWGLWEGTAEETAYALQTLLLTGDPEDHAVAVAVRGACDG